MTDLTSGDARRLLEAAAPSSPWTVHPLERPSTRQSTLAAAIDIALTADAEVTDQGGAGTVATVVVLADAALLAAAPDLARALTRAEQERDEARAEVARLNQRAVEHGMECHELGQAEGARDERARIVAWLRREPVSGWTSAWDDHENEVRNELADAIERGDGPERTDR